MPKKDDKLKDGKGSTDPVSDQDEIDKHIKSAYIDILSKIFTVVSTIISIVSVAGAYAKLNAAANDYNAIIDNWELTPIVDMAVITPGTSCAVGYDLIPSMKWKGDQSQGCACPTNSNQVTSTTSRACNTTETSTYGCVTDKPLESGSAPYDNWRGQNICIKRAGEPTVIDFDAYGTSVGAGEENAKIRPNPTGSSVSAVCPAGYTKCGTGNYDDDRAVCVPDADASPCPLTMISSPATVGDWENTGGSTGGTVYPDSDPLPGSTVTDGSSGTPASTLYYDRGNSYIPPTTYTGLPIVDIKMAFYADKRGPCYGDADQQSEYTAAAKLNYDNDANFYYPSSCDKTDPRWVNVDFMAEKWLLADSMFGADAKTASECYAIPGGSTTNAAAAYDYLNGGSQCSGSTAPSGCTRSPATLGTCKAGDDICENVKFQSDCGRLSHYYTEMAGKNYKIGLYAQPQIYWKTDCAISYSEVYEVKNPINKATDAQGAVVGVTITASVFIVIMTFFGFWRNYELISEKGSSSANTTDQCESVVDMFFNCFALPVGCGTLTAARREEYPYPEAQQINAQNSVKIAFRWSVVFFFIKLVPLVIVISTLAPLVGFFATFDDDQCSDPTTNETFNSLADALPAAYNDNITALVMDILMVILFPSITYLYGMLSPDSQPKDVSGPEAQALQKAKKDLEASKTTK